MIPEIKLRLGRNVPAKKKLGYYSLGDSPPGILALAHPNK